MLIFYDGANFVDVPDPKKEEGKKPIPVTNEVKRIHSDGIRYVAFTMKDSYVPEKKKTSFLKRIFRFIFN